MAVYILLGLIFSVLWLIFFIVGYSKNKSVIGAIDAKVYLVPELMSVGLGILDVFHIDTIKIGKAKKEKLVEIYDREYIEFQYLVLLAAKISFIAVTVPLAFFFAALANEPLVGLLFIFMGVALAVYFDIDVQSKIEKRHDEILTDYPNMLSKLALLVNAGMILRDAWKSVAFSGDNVIYKEMQLASAQIDNGTREIDAYTEFGNNCKVKEVKKFVSILCQNVEKGNTELVYAIKEMSTEAWVIKQHNAKRKGELASQRLLIPVAIMFVGILMMVLVPIIANMSF